MTLSTDTSGLRQKYRVERTDGRDVSGQEFFVLRIDTGADAAAIAAIEEYARQVWRTNPELSADLDRKVSEWRRD